MKHILDFINESTKKVITTKDIDINTVSDKDFEKLWAKDVKEATDAWLKIKFPKGLEQFAVDYVEKNMLDDEVKKAVGGMNTALRNSKYWNDTYRFPKHNYGQEVVTYRNQNYTDVLSEVIKRFGFKDRAELSDNPKKEREVIYEAKVEFIKGVLVKKVIDNNKDRYDKSINHTKTFYFPTNSTDVKTVVTINGNGSNPKLDQILDSWKKDPILQHITGWEIEVTENGIDYRLLMDEEYKKEWKQREEDWFNFRMQDEEEWADYRWKNR